MKNSILILLVLLSYNTAICQKVGLAQQQNLKNIESKIEILLDKMTIEEKVAQMSQFNGFWDVTGPVPKEGNAAIKYEFLKKGLGSMLSVHGVEQVKALQKIAVEETRLGIPLIMGYDVIHGYKTISPIPLAEAASWDLNAIRNSATVAATEAAAAGINWTFAPMVDISRDARWGRVMEGAGEDPYLGSKIAEARVKGFQGSDLSSINTIAATAKHFAGYGFSESGRDYNTVDIGTSTLYNIILPPFKAAVDADVKTLMNSFNDLNGVPVTGSSFLQRDILKKQWGFKGFVVSDWASIIEMVNWGVAKDRKDAAKIAVNAGSDMDMESYAYAFELVNLVKEGEVKESILDDAVRRILRVKFELGLFDDPYKYCNAEREKNVIGNLKHQKAVLDIAKKSIVLLKNTNNILPLKKQDQHIVLIGALAADKNSSLGSWRIASEDNSAISVLEGMQAYTNNTLVYKKGANVALGNTSFVDEVNINLTDKSEFNAALAAAKKANVVVMVLGEHGFQSGEARSRASLDLPGVQQELLEQVYKVNPNIVLVLNNGRPLAIPWADKHIPAIVEAWQLGSQAGNAIAQVLYGDYNPSGKLPISFPRSVGQVPIYYNHKNTGRALNIGNNVFWSHYIDEENSPLYPFGHGLSYTSFKYNNLQLDKITIKHHDKINVSVNVSNTGTTTGTEVVQLYIRDMVASNTRPVKELKGFQIVELETGKTTTVKFQLDKSTLGFYNAVGKYVLESGTFKVFVGGSSYTSLETSFKVE